MRRVFMSFAPYSPSVVVPRGWFFQRTLSVDSRLWEASRAPPSPFRIPWLLPYLFSDAGTEASQLGQGSDSRMLFFDRPGWLSQLCYFKFWTALWYMFGPAQIPVKESHTVAYIEHIPFPLFSSSTTTMDHEKGLPEGKDNDRQSKPRNFAVQANPKWVSSFVLFSPWVTLNTP